MREEIIEDPESRSKIILEELKETSRNFKKLKKEIIDTVEETDTIKDYETTVDYGVLQELFNRYKLKISKMEGKYDNGEPIIKIYFNFSQGSYIIGSGKTETEAVGDVIKFIREQREGYPSHPGILSEEQKNKLYFSKILFKLFFISPETFLFVFTSFKIPPAGIFRITK